MQSWCRVLMLSVATLGGAGEAAGPATSDTGAYVRWVHSEIELRPVVPPASTGTSAADLTRMLREAAREWNTALAGCHSPRLMIGEVLAGDARAIQDESSIVLVRDDDWCPERALDREDCYDERQAGITHLYPRRVPGSEFDGELREADIEINAVHFRWSSDGSLAGTQSLLALIVHELGHVMGLAHESTAASGYRESIMYPYPVETGRTPVLRPGSAEISQLCSLYSRQLPARPWPSPPR